MAARKDMVTIHVQIKRGYGTHDDLMFQDSLAEWSKALAPGASPQGRGLEAHSCQQQQCQEVWRSARPLGHTWRSPRAAMLGVCGAWLLTLGISVQLRPARAQTSTVGSMAGDKAILHDMLAETGRGR